MKIGGIEKNMVDFLNQFYADCVISVIYYISWGFPPWFFTAEVEKPGHMLKFGDQTSA